MNNEQKRICKETVVSTVECGGEGGGAGTNYRRQAIRKNWVPHPLLPALTVVAQWSG